MTKSSFLLSMLIVVLSINTPIFAQENNPLGKLITQKDANFNDRSYYEANSTLFHSDKIKQNSTINVQLPDGWTELTITRVSEYVPGIKSYRAVSTDGGIFSFSYANGAIYGIFHESHKKLSYFNFDKVQNLNYISYQSKGDVLGCDGIHGDEVVAESKLKALTNSDDSDFFGPNYSGGNDLEKNTIIDIMVVYTQFAKNWALEDTSFADINAVIAQAMNLSQTVLDNSEIPITLRLVHTYETDFDESPYVNQESPASDELLFKFMGTEDWTPSRNPDNEMNEIHPMRDEFGADIVVLFSDLADAGGKAYGIGNRRLGWPASGFNINRVQQVGTGYTLIHEIGHTMGLSHARTQERQPAPVHGGVFKEAVGYQYVDSLNGFATIMAYLDANTPGGNIPFFSSSSNTHQGFPIGSDNAENLSDATCSLKKIKNIIANYRSTKVDPPVFELTTQSITVDLAQNQSIQVPFAIQNTGASELNYTLDFQSSGNIDPSPIGLPFDSVMADTLFYADFESEDSFSKNSFFASKFWNTYETTLNLSNVSPKSGQGHLRLNTTNDEIFSPYLGPLGYGSYKVSFDMKIPDEANTNLTLIKVSILDGKTGQLNAGLSIRDYISTRANNEYGYNFLTTDKRITKDEYMHYEILFDGNQSQASYFINGEPMLDVVTDEPVTLDYEHQHTTPAEIVFWMSDRYDDMYLDIDNVTVTKYWNPYSWLSVDQDYVSVEPGETGTSTLTINALGVKPGTYKGNMTLFTNVDDSIRYSIPLTLNVGEAVSNEVEDGIYTFELNQNYPNPFNPSTNINFSLPSSSEVSLKVYNMLGQQVQSLVSGTLNRGKHSVQFDASSLASGVYIYQLIAGDWVSTKKMLLIK